MRAGAASGVLSAPVEPAIQVDPAATGSDIPVELTWSVAAAPADLRFYVEVATLGPGGTHDLIWQPTDVSALLIRLPPEPGRYAWRVFAVSPSSGHYAADAWSALSIERASSPDVAVR